MGGQHLPSLAKPLEIDDMVGNGELNPIKKWWWDIELYKDGGYKPARKPVNARGLQKDLDLKYEDQQWPFIPPSSPSSYPYPFHMDREAGIEAYQAMITAEEYKLKLERGETDHLHVYSSDGDAPLCVFRSARSKK